MLDYSLCDQTVTVYRMEGNTLHRQVLEGCHYAWEDVLSRDVPGGRLERKFLLIVPGSIPRIRPGDRIFHGVGPEEPDWQRFVPEGVPGLSVAAYVKNCRWGGDVCHTEAGR